MPAIKKASGGAESPRRAADSAAPGKTTGRGWGKVVEKKKAIDRNSEMRKRPAYLEVKNKFYLKEDGDMATIQILDEEPYCVEGCTLVADHYNFYTTRKMVAKSCPMVDAGNKLTWKACFKVLDYRGEWDKDSKDFKNDKPVERYWLVSNTVAQQIQSFAKRKGKPVNQVVMNVVKSGAGKNTTYNFEQAIDEDDNVIRAMVWKEKLPSSEEVMAPLPASTLDAIMSGEDPDEVETSAKPKRKKIDYDDDEIDP